MILTTPDEVETWMMASPDEALKLQRALPDRARRQGRSSRIHGVSPASPYVTIDEDVEEVRRYTR